METNNTDNPPAFPEFKDKSGNIIQIGDTLIGKTIDGKIAEFEVKWNDYRRSWVGENKDEIYDISSSIFHQYRIKARQTTNKE